MKKFEIIKNNKEFNNIIHNEKYVKNDFFVIYYKDRDISLPKFGITISTKFGKAHIRNYYKRITKNIIDINKKSFSNNRDYIIMIRKKCLNHKYNEIFDEFNKLIKEIK